MKQKHKEVIPIFIDISKLTESIKFFCDNLLTEFAKTYEKSTIEPDLDIFFHTFNQGTCYEMYQHYQKQTEPAKSFDKVLQLLTLISKSQKLVIILDEFQDMLEFTKIKGLKNLDAIFRAELQNQFNIFYVVTGSYPTILRDLIQNPQKKLYSHFEIYDIKNFDKEASIQLINGFKKNLPHEQKIALYQSCNGSPYLMSLILQKVDLWLLGDLEQNFKNLLFDKKGAIYNHYEYLLEESLSKIQNSIILKAILKEIAMNDRELRLTELAKKIWTTSQQIHFGLKQLSKVDILYQTPEKRRKFQDVLFSYFIAYSLGGVENYEFEKSNYYLNQVHQLQEKLNRALTELGRTKEFELYYEIRQHQGKIWNNIKLPLFKTIQKNFYTPDGSEIDLYCETLRGKRRVFEYKYRTKQVGEKEIEQCIQKIPADQYVYISKSWFSTTVDKKEWEKKNMLCISLES